MDRFLALLIAHILADFPLQAGVIYTWKTQSNLGIWIHSSIHIFVFYILFEPPRDWWPALIALLVMHYLIDWAKFKWPVKPQIVGFILDQFWHVLSLIPIALIFKDMVPSIPQQYLVPDFLLAMVSPILLMFWTYSFDLGEMSPNHRYYKLVDWSKQNLLRWSQIAGFISVAIILLHILD